MSPFPFFFQPIRATRPTMSRVSDIAFHPEHFAGMFEFPARLNKMMSEMANELPVATKDGFQATFDVKEFKPEEINVKTKDNVVYVEGKHDERHDEHSLISRHFVRKFVLPKDANINQISSILSSDGVLTIKAPKLFEVTEEKERVIEIQKTGPVKEAIKDETETK